MIREGVGVVKFSHPLKEAANQIKQAEARSDIGDRYSSNQSQYCQSWRIFQRENVREVENTCYSAEFAGT